jgi:hypothetical protein
MELIITNKPIIAIDEPQILAFSEKVFFILGCQENPRK